MSDNLYPITYLEKNSPITISSNHLLRVSDSIRKEFPAPSRDTATDGIDGDIEWMPDFIEEMFDNSDRHAVGLGIVQRLFGTGDLDPNSPAILERTKFVAPL